MREIYAKRLRYSATLSLVNRIHPKFTRLNTIFNLIPVRLRQANFHPVESFRKLFRVLLAVI
jgi:hypothetical protein